MAAHVRSLICSQTTMEVVVLYTTTAETLRSLKAAALLAHGLSARIRLLILEVVPYPLPLDQPAVPVSFTQRRFRTLAANVSVETIVDIHLVRDRDNVMDSVLEPHSIVVTAASGSWWPYARNGSLKRLERAGHQVVYA